MRLPGADGQQEIGREGVGNADFQRDVGVGAGGVEQAGRRIADEGGDVFE
jgi:hypothetical protein